MFLVFRVHVSVIYFLNSYPMSWRPHSFLFCLSLLSLFACLATKRFLASAVVLTDAPYAVFLYFCFFPAQSDCLILEPRINSVMSILYFLFVYCRNLSSDCFGVNILSRPMWLQASSLRFVCFLV